MVVFTKVHLKNQIHKKDQIIKKSFFCLTQPSPDKSYSVNAVNGASISLIQGPWIGRGSSYPLLS